MEQVVACLQSALFLSVVSGSSIAPFQHRCSVKQATSKLPAASLAADAPFSIRLFPDFLKPNFPTKLWLITKLYRRGTGSERDAFRSNKKNNAGVTLVETCKNISDLLRDHGGVNYSLEGRHSINMVRDPLCARAITGDWVKSQTQILYTTLFAFH